MLRLRSRLALRLASLLGLVSALGSAPAAMPPADAARQSLLARVDAVRAQFESQAQPTKGTATGPKNVAQWLNWPNWNNWNNWPNWGNWNNWVNWFNR